MTQRTTHEPGTVTTRVADGVASVAFGHPKGNSLPGVLLAELAARITALGQEPQASVIVLRSEGTGAFCAGASFAELSGIADVESGTRFFMGFANLMTIIPFALVPPIAALLIKFAGGYAALFWASAAASAMVVRYNRFAATPPRQGRINAKPDCASPRLIHRAATSAVVSLQSRYSVAAVAR